MPPPVPIDYVCPPALRPLILSRSDRLPFWVRDKGGRLTLCFRPGPIDWRLLFKAMGSDEDLFLKCGYWCLEMVLQDAIQLYRKDGTEPYWSVIIDLENWKLAKQLPIPQALRVSFFSSFSVCCLLFCCSACLVLFSPHVRVCVFFLLFCLLFFFWYQLARKFLSVVPRVYPEILRRVVIIRAPWVFQKVWIMFRALFPAEIIAKISIHTGVQNFASVFDVLNVEKIPVSYGGEWSTGAGGEDVDCSSHFGPGVSYWNGSLENSVASGGANYAVPSVVNPVAGGPD